MPNGAGLGNPRRSGKRRGELGSGHRARCRHDGAPNTQLSPAAQHHDDRDRAPGSGPFPGHNRPCATHRRLRGRTRIGAGIMSLATHTPLQSSWRTPFIQVYQAFGASKTGAKILNSRVFRSEPGIHGASTRDKGQERHVATGRAGRRTNCRGGGPG